MAIKYILIMAGITGIIYGAARDADLITFIGIGIFIAAFFLKQIVHAFKR